MPNFIFGYILYVQIHVFAERESYVAAVNKQSFGSGLGLDPDSIRSADPGPDSDPERQK